jgi:predicted amidohydrolase YtcJ
VAFGSDWPVSSPDPLAEIHVAVTRTSPPGLQIGADDPEARSPFIPDERISLGAALRAFTLGSAYVNGLDSETGSLEVGKLADLAVIDRNLFEVDAADGGLPAGEVVMTFVQGEAVFERSGSGI